MGLTIAQLAEQMALEGRVDYIDGTVTVLSTRIENTDQRLDRANGRLDKAAQIVGQLQQRLGRVERKLEPGAVITDEQASEIMNRVKAIAESLRDPSKNHYQSIFGELYRLFKITSYKLVPQSRYAVVLADRPFVPPGHEVIFAHGLLAGFRSDFLVASHLLVPQIEQSIRYLLTLSDVIPYGLDDDRIQKAHLLDTVLRRPETARILGEEVVYDLKVLLVDHLGTNLRNRLSHGLMRTEEFGGWPTIYLWWVVLRLCLRLAFTDDSPEQASGEEARSSK